MRVKQLDCDQGTNSWNLVMKPTLDQETRYSEFNTIWWVAKLKKLQGGGFICSMTSLGGISYPYGYEVKSIQVHVSHAWDQ